MIKKKNISKSFGIIVKHFVLTKLISSFITLVLVLLIKYYFYGGFTNTWDLSQGFILGFSGLVLKLGILGLVEGLFEYYHIDLNINLYDLLHKPLLASQCTDSGISSPSSTPRPSSSSSAPATFSSSSPGPSSPIRPSSSSSAPASMAGWSIPSAKDNNLNYSVDAEGQTLISCWRINLDKTEEMLATSSEEFLNKSGKSVTTRESLKEYVTLYKGLIYMEECKARGFNPGHTENTLVERKDAIQAWHELSRFRYRMSMSEYNTCVAVIEQHNANVNRLSPDFYNEILTIPK